MFTQMLKNSQVENKNKPTKENKIKAELPQNIIESAACLVIKRWVFCQVNLIGGATDGAALVIVPSALFYFYLQETKSTPAKCLFVNGLTIRENDTGKLLG